MDSNFKIILTDIAKEDLEEIYEYISEHLLEKAAANRLMNKIEEDILRLEQNPYSCVEVHIKPHNDVYRKLTIENYVALYEIDEMYKNVIIYRIIYGKKDYLMLIDD